MSAYQRPRLRGDGDWPSGRINRSEEYLDVRWAARPLRGLLLVTAPPFQAFFGQPIIDRTTPPVTAYNSTASA